MEKAPPQQISIEGISYQLLGYRRIALSGETSEQDFDVCSYGTSEGSAWLHGEWTYPYLRLYFPNQEYYGMYNVYGFTFNPTKKWVNECTVQALKRLNIEATPAGLNYLGFRMWRFSHPDASEVLSFSEPVDVEAVVYSLFYDIEKTLKNKE